MNFTPEKIELFGTWLAQCDGVLICAGAGMGVDSGLPDFRGNQGFWQAYPALKHLGLDFSSVAQPRTFVRHPQLAWGFYGHRLSLYRQTAPHQGFDDLLKLAERFSQNYFVFTSNVDGQFQKAGFSADRIVECHGSIHHMQCIDDCSGAIWSAGSFVPQIDAASCQLINHLPNCPHCNSLARPNILMFGDWAWQSSRTEQQYTRLENWLAHTRRPLVIELGAGVAIPSVRHMAERFSAHLVRINPRDYDLPNGRGINLAMGAREGVQQLMGVAQSI